MTTENGMEELSSKTAIKRTTSIVSQSSQIHRLESERDFAMNEEDEDETRLGIETDGNSSFVTGITTSSRMASDKAKRAERWILLNIFRLRPNYSLRTQLFLAFGISTFVSFFVIASSATLIANQSGKHVKRLSHRVLEKWALKQIGAAPFHISDAITQKIDNFHEMTRFLKEITSDRFRGYPDYPGYDEDILAPFRDMDATNSTLKYPWGPQPLPLDWAFQPNVFEHNAQEHVQDRFHWYQGDIASMASILMPGSCDPQAKPGDAAYVEGCSDEHNDITTGGKTQPTDTYYQIHQKASTFALPVLKAFYEYFDDIKSVGMSFNNDGAGAIVSYPAETGSSQQNYTSIGCDWMLESRNPLNRSKFLATPEQVARCHKEGEVVSSREYNPLERDWCRHQALSPHVVKSEGPYLDAFDNDQWLMTFGQAVYDYHTKELIACIFADVSVERLNAAFAEVMRTTSTDDFALVRWRSGTVVASSFWDPKTTNRTLSIEELEGMDVDEELFVEMKDQFDREYKKNNIELTAISRDQSLFSGYSIPKPPSKYNPNFRPEFMIIYKINKASMFEDLSELDVDIEQEVIRLHKNAVIAASLGFLSVLACIYLVAIHLTIPMNWIGRVGDQIVNSMGSSNKCTIRYESPSFLKYERSTEITELVKEFQKTVLKFSGEGTAKLSKHETIEVKNPFELHEIFAPLYRRRCLPNFKHKYQLSSRPLLSNISGSSSRNIYGVYRNWDPNLRSADSDSTNASTMPNSLGLKTGKREVILRSRLLWWILGTIVMPLLLTLSAIAVYVTLDISSCLPRLIDNVEDTFVGYERSALDYVALVRAEYASQLMSSFIRDLHMFFRTSGWLLFGGIVRSDSFPKLLTLAEKCRQFESPFECPVDPNEAVCDCAWGDKKGFTCYNYTKDTRLDQLMFYILSSQNTLNWTGVRNYSGFPEIAFSPQTTAWVHDVDTVPGAKKGVSAAGYETTYDRLRVASASSVIAIPLINYHTQSLLVGSSSTSISFEADGIFMSYAGCDITHAGSAHYKATNETVVNTDLCPYEQYGYDPRCRDWYADTKQLAQKNAETGHLLHITPPFVHAGSNNVIAISAGQSILDPNTGELVAIVANDVNVSALVNKLSQQETPLYPTGFHVLINTERDEYGHDVVVGPGFEDALGVKAIEDLLFKAENCKDAYSQECKNKDDFVERILPSMQAGDHGSTEYRRQGEDGREEIVYFHFAPIKLKAHRPMDPSDISRGVLRYEIIPLSIALGEPRNGIVGLFNEIEGPLEHIVKYTIGGMVSLIIFSVTLIALISIRVTRSVVIPVSQLSAIVRNINQSQVVDNLPFIEGGSSEISKVYDTIEKLHMVVSFANTAFFSGELQKAHSTLLDALVLFKSLDNKKAIGVANNNLGNTMLTAFRVIKKTGAPSICGLKKEQIVNRGIQYFDAAIDAGEKAISRINEEEGFSTNYLIFMQQLSNRYFNRAIFLLTVKDDHPNPSEAQHQGNMDLSTTKHMDREVVDNGDKQGFKGDDDEYFDLMMSRIKGVLMLLKLGFDDEWGLTELFDDASKELVRAMEQPDRCLFKWLGPVGQMQRLDGAFIEYYRISEDKDFEKAAEVAVRMLCEDSYCMGESAAIAVKALIEYCDQVNAEILGGEDPSNVKTILFQYRKYISEAMVLSLHGRDVIGMECARQCNVGDFSMEDF